MRTWRRPAPARAATAAGGLSVLYEDAEVLAVDKPAGINVAIENEGESISSLQSLASDYLATKNEGSALLGPRARLVHRIDKDTSGVVLLAKTPRAQSMLGREWEGGRVEKVYLAIVRGAPEYESGLVDAPIGRDPDRKNRRAVGGLDAQEARTRVKVLERLGGRFSLVEARPLTGRTHQIRVHLASIGCPLAIDPLYAASDAKKPPEIHRLTLHAKALTVPLPKNGRPHTIEAPIPDDFRRALEALRALPPEAPPAPAPPAKKTRARRKR